MTERPIYLNSGQVVGVRTGKRTHICMPAHKSGGHRLSVIDDNQMRERSSDQRLPSIWTALKPGDRLWVREDICELADDRLPLNGRQEFRADCIGGTISIPGGGARRGRWSTRVVNGFHLDQEWSRYTLIVKAVRVFLCQEISWEEIKAEGAVHYPSDSKNGWWDRSYGITLPWAHNPKVVGVAFEFLDANVAGKPPQLMRPATREEKVALAGIERAAFGNDDA